MDNDRERLPAELNEYIDKRIVRALRRQAHAALRKKINSERASQNISLKTKLLFVISIILCAMAGFALTLLIKNYLS